MLKARVRVKIRISFSMTVGGRGMVKIRVVQRQEQGLIPTKDSRFPYA